MQFRVIVVTDQQTNKHTNRQGRLQYTAPQLAGSVIISKNSYIYCSYQATIKMPFKVLHSHRDSDRHQHLIVCCYLRTVPLHKFIKNSSTTFRVILLTDKHTVAKNITSLAVLLLLEVWLYEVAIV